MTPIATLVAITAFAIGISAAPTPATDAPATNDVYSIFLTSGGAQIGSVHYDVSNPGCFSNHGAAQLAFNQEDTGLHGAYGPYCLNAYNDDKCNSFAANQVFRNVDNTGGQKYALSSGVAGPGNYRWHVGAC